MNIIKSMCLFITLSFLSPILIHAQQRDVVVLLHGLGRGKSIMTPLKERLDTSGFITRVVDYRSIGRTPEEIIRDVSDQLTEFRLDTFRTVHFAGHSLGGLLIRAYLDSVTLPNLGRVVLIGSPSKGTPFVDHFRDTWWMKIAGPAARALGTDAKSFPRTLHTPHYPVGIIAGKYRTFNNDDFIPGEDDGVVPVESTKVEGMTDFILVEVSHSSLPRNEEVAEQVKEFLRKGRFKRTAVEP